jgi:hypothetical protein
VPPEDITMVAASLPSAFLPKLLLHLVAELEHSRHVEFNVREPSPAPPPSLHPATQDRTIAPIVWVMTASSVPPRSLRAAQ